MRKCLEINMSSLQSYELFFLLHNKFREKMAKIIHFCKNTSKARGFNKICY